MTTTVEKRIENNGPMVAGIDMRVVASWFVDQLDGCGTWLAMPEKERSVYASAMARTMRRIAAPSGDVIETLADAMDISPTTLIGKDRRADIVARRHVAIWHLYTNMARNIMRVSRMFACDHSSALYAVSKVQRALENGDPETMQLAARCKEAVGGERSVPYAT